MTINTSKAMKEIEEAKLPKQKTIPCTLNNSILLQKGEYDLALKKADQVVKLYNKRL
ncbi:hypothetical protein [Sulfuracidifex metallicus]|uniref:hypothetical protein n=1 Tax=Sulfuracidifex metallicus TaxID=47303 RepID=UPI000AA5AA50|nr:hypothetical protein [Sulfuracidifex metallicus]